MADHIPNYREAQEMVDAMEADIDIMDAEVSQEEEDTEGIAQVDRRLPERLLWCLACHQKGHRAQNCSETPVDIHAEDPWDLLSRVSRPPRPTEVYHRARRVMNLLSISDVESSEFAQHIIRRDALLSAIYHEMVNWNAPLGHETWFHFMSAFHKMVDEHADQVRAVLDRIRLHFNGNHAFINGNIRDHLSLLDAGRFTSIMPQPGSIYVDLDWLLHQFEENFSYFVAGLEVYLVTSPEIQSLNAADSAWMCKAFWVLIGVQPFFEPSPVYFARWHFPHIDDVVEYEGLDT